MIIINLKDGLGNQLFEYAYARWVSEQYGEKLVFNNYFFDGAKRRSYSLHHFKLNDEIEILPENKQKIYTLKFMARLAAVLKVDFYHWLRSTKRPKGAKNFEKMSKKGLYVSFEPFIFYPFVKSKKKDKFIYGNFESALYFPGMEDILRKELVIKTQPSEANQKMIEELEKEESVCVHIRRGDYLDPKWKMLQVCTYDYYKKAIEEVHKRVPNAKFYVFSNTSEDLQWIKENYQFDYDMNYVDLSNPDYEELRLMSKCKHFVLSNSSFSWWGSYLSSNKDKVIIAPSKWIRGEDDKGIYREEFIKVDVE